MENEYAKEITKQAVARACAAFNFKTANSDCIDILADIIKNYIRTVSVAARDEAENAGRVCVGIQDVIKVLDQDPIFETECQQLYEFGLDDEAKGVWKQPFPFDIKCFPVENVSDMVDYQILSGGLNAHDQHIPTHLPPFPPSHTYSRRNGSKKRSEIASSANIVSDAKRTKAVVVKGALNALSSIEESADIHS